MGHLNYYQKMDPSWKRRRIIQVICYGNWKDIIIFSSWRGRSNDKLSLEFSEDEVRDAVLVTDGDSEIGQVNFLVSYTCLIVF